ncbi:hypothetical protein ACFSW8_05320 [Rubritalea tangerina]|uniref:Uncharacterized protein n=2 Tax=Rubritalea tangerina TaxID=430798 RepID=A0ABW4Z9S9_9BACT
MEKVFHKELLDLNINNMAFHEALDQLVVMVYSSKIGGVGIIMPGEMKKVKVSLMPQKSMTFGKALDSICLQAGYTWEFTEYGKLRISPKK